jgi:hypothetical protein
MRTALFALLILSAGSLAAQDAKVDEVGKTPIEAKFAPGGKVRLDLCPSGVELIGKDDNLIRVTYDGKYSSSDNVRVRLEVSGAHADLRITGCPHNNFKVTVEVPKSTNLYARMFAGQLNVNGIDGDKDVSMSAGQLTMEICKPEQCAHVEASVYSGDLSASAFGVGKGGLFRSFERSGPGKYRVYAHVGAGQLDLR